MGDDELNSPLWKRIWAVSKILHCNPFSADILNLTTFQMDLIIETWIRDNPDAQLQARKLDTSQVDQLVEWANKLEGKALKEFLRSPKKFIPKP